jgi:hypothetical protein
MAGEITGFLHVMRVPARLDPVNAEYRIVFAPLGGRLRGRRVSCLGLDALTDFLSPDSGDRTSLADPREAPGSLHSAHRPDASPARGARALAPSDCAKGDEAMGVYADLRNFVLAHRTCAGSRHANAGPPTVDGYRVSVVCGCGAELKRRVTLDDADEDLLKSALLAFEN